MNKTIVQTLPALRMILSGDGPLRTLKLLEGGRVKEELHIETPDPDGMKRAVGRFVEKSGRMPGVILIDGVGTVEVGENTGARRAEGRIIIVTGAAQGFGEGIASCLVAEGANVVVADLNESVGRQTAERLKSQAGASRAIFVKTDVSSPESLENLICETVKEFGGLDVFISNAGILRAGGVEEMTPETFDLVTKINYNAYFYCVKAAAPVMKLQNRYGASRFCDIIQINSKSGLRGSKANFAYAGGKFGGVGLTQSFALELAPFRIKVNSVCPGNFYEGPLWSDPENGLFIQYLDAGKVPGAKTIEDVRRHYMAQVPMGKGTNPADVTRAILYAIEQTCETGQAIPVTGGQIMLS